MRPEASSLMYCLNSEFFCARAAERMPTTGMEKFRVQIAIVFAMVSLVNAFPAPQLDEDGQELLGGKDTRYYGLPFFWYGRPFYEDNDDYTGNGGLNINTNNKRSSTVSYANVGAGWGR